MRKIYTAAFTITDGKKPANLDAIISTAEEWARPLFANSPIAGFDQGTEQSNEKAEVRTIRTKEKETEHFAMLLGRPDDTIEGFYWSTTLCISENNPGKYRVTISVENGWKDATLKPGKLIVTRPRIVPVMINKFTASEDYLLRTTPRIISKDEAPLFTRTIFDDNRTLPIVFASCNNYTGKPIVDTKKIADQLAGIAHVCQAADTDANLALEKIFGKSMACYNGAIRVYWPAPGKDTGIIHPLWTPWQIDQKQNVAQDFLSTISKFSIGRSTPSYEDVRRIVLAQKIASLSDRDDIRELANLYASENTKLKEDIAAYKLREAESAGTIRYLDQRVDGLEKVLQMFKEGTHSPDDESSILSTINSVDEAVKKFVELYDNKRIVVLPKIKGYAKSCPYKHPDKVFKALEWLATAYLAMRDGELKGDLEKSCMEQTGMEYKSHQSKITMGVNPDDYYVIWNGQTRALQEHIGRGISRDPRESVRIGFFYDKNTKKVVIGYLGQHQTTRAS